MTIALESVLNDTYNYKTPIAAATVTLNDDDWHVILDPAGALANLTVQMCANPFNGQIVDVRTSQAITALTVAGNAGQAIANGAPATLAAGARFSAIYRAANTTWYVA